MSCRKRVNARNEIQLAQDSGTARKPFPSSRLEAEEYSEQLESWRTAIDHVYTSLGIIESKIAQIEPPTKKSRIRRGYSYRHDVLTNDGRECLESIVTSSVLARSVAIRVHELFSRRSPECFDSWVLRISEVMDSLMNVPSFRRRSASTSQVLSSTFTVFRKTVVDDVIQQISLGMESVSSTLLIPGFDMTAAAVFSSQFLTSSRREEAFKLFLSGSTVHPRVLEDVASDSWSRVRALTILLWLFDVVTKFLASNRRAARDTFLKSIGYLFLSWPPKYGCSRATLRVEWTHADRVPDHEEASNVEKAFKESTEMGWRKTMTAIRNESQSLSYILVHPVQVFEGLRARKNEKGDVRVLRRHVHLLDAAALWLNSFLGFGHSASIATHTDTKPSTIYGVAVVFRGLLESFRKHHERDPCFVVEDEQVRSGSLTARTCGVNRVLTAAHCSRGTLWLSRREFNQMHDDEELIQHERTGKASFSSGFRYTEGSSQF